MQARILPGRGSGGRSRTTSSGTGKALAASRSKAGRSASKLSMICSIRCCGEWATNDAVADETSTTPAAVSTPGRIPRPAPGPSKSTSRIQNLPFLTLSLWGSRVQENRGKAQAWQHTPRRDGRRAKLCLTNTVSHEILDGLLSIYRLLMNGLPALGAFYEKRANSAR